MAKSSRSAHLLPLLWVLIAAPPLVTALLVTDMAPFGETNGMIIGMAAHAIVVEFIVLIVAVLLVGVGAIRAVVPRFAWALIGIWLLFNAWSTAQYGAFDGAALGAAIDVVQLAYALALAALLASAGREQRRRLGDILIVAWLLFIIGAYAFAAMIPDDPDYPWDAFGYATRNIRPLATFIAIGGMFAFAETYRDEARIRRWIGLATFLLAFAFVAGSGSRAPFLGMLVPIVIAFPFLAREHRARFYTSAAACIALAMPLALAWAPDFPGFGLRRVLWLPGEGEVLPGGSGRIELWLATFDKILEMPIQGYGRHHFFEIVDSPHWFPHNVVLQYWFDWGWIGGSAALLLLAAIFIASLRALRRSPAQAAGPYAAIACVLFVALLDGPLFDTLPIFAFATFTAMLLAVFKARRR